MLISVTEAQSRLLEHVTQLPAVQTPLADAAGFVLSENVTALRTQPPFDASAMDGYAIDHSDNIPGQRLHVIGESAAGHRFRGQLKKGQAARIFTGAPLPEGADTIIIQENAKAEADHIIIETPANNIGQYVRPKGLDFAENDIGLKAGQLLRAEHIAFAAAMGHLTLPIIRPPKVAILSLGDELKNPGETLGQDDIVSSNAYGIAALMQKCGARAVDAGIAADTLHDTVAALSNAIYTDADIIVTSGGASVGDHDFTKAAFEELGVTIDFWKIAMRPGKPLMVGRRDDTIFLGLPGNPVSSMVCAHLFLRPLLAKMMSQPSIAPLFSKAILGADIPPNDRREEYMRGTIKNNDGNIIVTPYMNQDSSILSLMASADCLIQRPANAPTMTAGEIVNIIYLTF